MTSRGKAPVPRTQASRLRRWIRVVRQIFGMPDYARYLEDRRSSGSTKPVLSPREHYLRFVEARYRGGGLRCC